MSHEASVSISVLVGHHSLALSLESSGCCDLLLIYTSLGSKAEKCAESCLASARVVKFHDVAFCHHTDPLGHPVTILTLTSFP